MPDVRAAPVFCAAQGRLGRFQPFLAQVGGQWQFGGSSQLAEGLGLSLGGGDHGERVALVLAQERATNLGHTGAG